MYLGLLGSHNNQVGHAHCDRLIRRYVKVYYLLVSSCGSFVTSLRVRTFWEIAAFRRKMCLVVIAENSWTVVRLYYIQFEWEIY